MSSNWKADSRNRWTVLLGGVGRVFKVGNQPANSRLATYYNVVRPDGAPDWQFRFTWQFLFPKSTSAVYLFPYRNLPLHDHFRATNFLDSSRGNACCGD